MKKVYITVETAQPLKTLDTILDTLDGEPGVTYAEGRIGWSGSTKKRRYELERLFSGVQPEDYGIKPREQTPTKRKGRRRR